MSRQNLCPNPACGTNSTGWTSNSTIARATDITGLPVTTGQRFTGNGFVQTPTGVAVAATAYTASVYVKNSTGLDSGNKTVYLAFTRSAGGDDFSQTFTKSYANGVVTRVDVTGTAPALATGVYLILDALNGTLGSGIDISACMYEAAAAPVGTYFDGNSPSAAWDGTTNNSTSTLTDTGIVPTGLAIPLTFGTPTVALGISAQPTGLSLPISFGNPTVTTPAAPTPSPTTANRGGWFGLLAIAQEAREMRREDRARQPIECPHDGQPLDMNAEGILHCPYDGWTWNGSEVL